jgi:ATP-dependent DNA helicase RecG
VLGLESIRHHEPVRRSLAAAREFIEEQVRERLGKGAATVRARHQDEVGLIGLAATVPFDDRINHFANVSDLNLGLIRAFLQQVGSDLFADATDMGFITLCRRMSIVDGPDEFVRPKNVGLMFFNEHPGRFFPQAQIDVVHFPDGPGADLFLKRFVSLSPDESLVPRYRLAVAYGQIS